MKEIPAPTKKRLILLERLLADYKEERITSQKIQSITGWTSAVVRRDFYLLELKCGSSNGYKVQELRDSIKKALNLSGKKIACCLVGLDRVGQMLLDGGGLDGSGFCLTTGFDSNVNKTEVLSSSFPLHSTIMLETVIRAESIKYAVLAVDDSEAQKMTDRLVACGIKGIVNYTSCLLTVPAGVSVENVSLLTALKTLAAGN